MNSRIDESTIDEYLLGFLTTKWREYVEEAFDENSNVQQWFIDRRSLPDHILYGEDGEYASELLDRLKLADQFQVSLANYLKPVQDIPLQLAARTDDSLRLTRRVYEWKSNASGSISIELCPADRAGLIERDGQAWIPIDSSKWQGPALKAFKTELNNSSKIRLDIQPIDYQGIEFIVSATEFRSFIEQEMAILVEVETGEEVRGCGRNQFSPSEGWS
jgi:hypothetical protein